MKQTEALKLALEALEAARPYEDWDTDKRDEAITAIKEALAQPEQEPITKLFGTLPIYDEHEFRKGFIAGQRDAFNRLEEQPEQEPHFFNLTVKVRGTNQVLDITGLYDDTVFVDLPSQPKEPEQGPVAWMSEHRVEELRKGFTVMTTLTKQRAFKDDVAIYTKPPQPAQPEQDEYLSKAYRLANELRCHLAIAPAPQRTWVGLTESDRRLINFQWQDGNGTATEIIDLVEAKLKEKNT